MNDERKVTRICLCRFVNGRNVKIKEMTTKRSSEILGDEKKLVDSKFLVDD